ncbi:hypothetical protein DPMN_174323 [Dreissena polymorpha]|uniref:Uncharacterized protein n=1 Tax=Dreissena polymorpha TaxID=45954 RepID=A0A9D4E5T0_DREPO|nr:hypothetical protein DPMN_174323 [Dreissena polymorpha]
MSERIHEINTMMFIYPFSLTFQFHFVGLEWTAAHDDLVKNYGERVHVSRLGTPVLKQVVGQVLRGYP